MSTPHGNGYIGASEPSAREKETKNELNFKETELRLGLPGSDSPERKNCNGVSLFGKDLKEESDNNGFPQSPLKSAFVSGGKRGFNDVINDNNHKWGLCVSHGSEVETGKKDVLFSSRGMNISNCTSGLKSCLHGNSVKEVSNAIPVKPVQAKKNETGSSGPASKAQVVGWPPVRSFRKNTLAANPCKDSETTEKSGPSSCLYVKVSLDGAPYLRKIDLKSYASYTELSSALEKMFSCFTIGQYGEGLAGKERLSESRLVDLLHGSEYVLTYEDKDGDWMLVGDVPWEMFTDSCKRMRIMKGSDVIGLAPRAMQKSKSQNSNEQSNPQMNRLFGSFHSVRVE